MYKRARLALTCICMRKQMHFSQPPPPRERKQINCSRRAPVIKVKRKKLAAVFIDLCAVNLSRVDLKLQRGGCNVKSLQQRRGRGKLVAWFQGSAMDRRILAADERKGVALQLSIVVARGY
jgi:hypothetical protein